MVPPYQCTLHSSDIREMKVLFFSQFYLLLTTNYPLQLIFCRKIRMHVIRT